MKVFGAFGKIVNVYLDIFQRIDLMCVVPFNNFCNNMSNALGKEMDVMRIQVEDQCGEKFVVHQY